jgi:hypothetical protein
MIQTFLQLKYKQCLELLNAGTGSAGAEIQRAGKELPAGFQTAVDACISFDNNSFAQAVQT